MKSIEVLEWICRESINGESLNIVEVHEEGEESWEQNEEWWTNMFGACPPCPLSEWRYLYYYEDATIGEMRDARGAYVSPDAMIELPTDNGFDYIYLYKLED